ncbi:calmodulin-binding protein 25-like [Miscanthus floridulus]|uniref:calmodulin-binding protein 25-like n=1 Tax=Miscanthus floridulus TaxID=154761 RepID=UPI003459E8BA
MDAVSLSCAGVAPQSALLSHSFADAAIARALHFSLSDHDPEPPPVATTAMLMHGAVAGTDCPGPAMAAAPSPSSSARCRLGPAGGHAGKRRRPRPSKRAPTTYISTDAATFRAMVQRVTGADETDLLQPQQQQDGSLGIGLLLPHLGVEQFLQAAGHAPHVAAAAPYATATPAAAAEQQQPLFPTLDSWNVMYGKKNEVVSALTASP